MQDLGELAMTAMMPEDIIGEPLPTKPYSTLLNGEAYIRATETNWASYQVGFVSPFSIVSNPIIKYGDTVSYKVGFAFFGNQMGPRTPNVTPADLATIMSMMDTTLSTNFWGQSETTTHQLVDSAV